MDSSSQNKQSVRKSIFDPVRRAWVKATPEELIRQQWLQRMLASGYPKEYIVVEKQIEGLKRRLDILCYGKAEDSIFPLLLIECKAARVTEEAVNQLIGYNRHVGARFVAVAAADEFRFGFVLENNLKVCPYLPAFKELMQWQH